MPGLPVHHQLPESTQTHVKRVGDAIQPSHLLSSPSPPAINLSQYQGLFKWVIRWPKYWSFSFNISPSNEHSRLVGSSCSPRDSQESSPTAQFKSSSHQVTKVLEFQLQHQSFQWTLRTGWISLQSKGLSRVSSNTTVQKHQFFSTELFSQSNSHVYNIICMISELLNLLRCILWPSVTVCFAECYT